MQIFVSKKVILLVGVFFIVLAGVIGVTNWKIKNTQSIPGLQNPLNNQLKIPLPEISQTNTSTWKTYRNEKYGFEVKYPNDWNFEAIPGYDDAGKVIVKQSDFLFTDSTLHRIIITPFRDLVADNPSGVSETRSINFNGIIGRWRKFADSGGVYQIVVDQFHITQYPQFSILFIPINARSYIDSEKSYEFNQILSTFKFIEPVSIPYSLKFSPDGKSLLIFANGQMLKNIYIKNIPPFDTNGAGEQANPEIDYGFVDINGNDFYDPFHNRIYFVVYNQSTAGNVNADRALFAYNLSDSKITLVDKKDLSTSFGIFRLSPSKRYLVFSNGAHGGGCDNTLELTILDLDNGKEVDNVFLQKNQVGFIFFGSWVDDVSFTYKEETYKSLEDCPKNPTIQEKVFKINTYYH